MYLGSTITDNLPLHTDKMYKKASTSLGRLIKRVWEDSKLTTYTKMTV